MPPLGIYIRRLMKRPRRQPERKAHIVRARRSRKSKRQKYCKLKQQIQLRSLSDCCSSSQPGQLMMDPESSEVDRHIWSVEEEEFLLQPFATDFEAEQERYKYDKTEYCQTAADKLNGRFEKRGWVPMNSDKVRRKFRAFGERYKAYLSGEGYRGPPETPTMKCYLRVELYIALYGGAFIEPLTSSRSRSCSRSRTPSESSVGPSSVKRRRPTKKEENDITAAGKIMSDQCDQVTWVWYLRALEDESIRRGFWIRADTEKKTYLDALLPMVKSEYYLKHGLKDPSE